jgi:hypothetical protein
VLLAAGLVWSSTAPTDPNVRASGWFGAAADEVAQGFAAQVTTGQLRRLLRERTRGVRASSPAPFLSGVAPAARPAQRVDFARLDVVPFRGYRVSLTRSFRLPPDGLRSGSLEIPVRLAVRLPFDPVVARDTADATFRLVHGRWRLVDVAPRHPEVWDLDTVAVARGARSLVLSDPSVMPAAALAGEADVAVRAVQKVWPGPWSKRVVVVLPSSQEDLETLVGVAGSGGVAAVTSSRDTSGPAAVRVQLNPGVFPGLVPLARQILIRHEITHAAQYAQSTKGVPAWLAEGIAEYVGYLGSGVPDSVVAASVLAEVGRGVVPPRLPTDRDFRLGDGSGDRRQAYEVSWAACRSVVDRYGRQALFDLYDAARDLPAARSARTGAALREVLGVSPRQFTAQWQSWLRSRA